MGDLPITREVTAAMDPRPRYRGTIHEDATARAMGYRAALVPGAFVYGYVTRLALDIWGEDWLVRGRAQVRFRRPVFAGDRLRIDLCPMPDANGPGVAEAGGPEAEGAGGPEAGAAAEAAGPMVQVTVRDIASGAVVLEGSVGHGGPAPAPPWPLTILPLPEAPIVLTPGEVPLNRPLGSRSTVLTQALVHESLDDFHDPSAVYRDRGLIHSGMLIRQTMSDTLANFALPMPVIFAATEVQMLALAPIGARYATAGRLLRAWERKGKYYFDSEEWLLADDRPVARHIRTNLYAVAS